MIKDKLKNLITPFRILLLVAVISVVANLWFFGGKWIAKEKQAYLNGGAIQMRDLIFNTAKQQGWIIIGNSSGEQIKLEIEQ